MDSIKAIFAQNDREYSEAAVIKIVTMYFEGEGVRGPADVQRRRSQRRERGGDQKVERLRPTGA